jgi:hypothetical protein
LRRRIALAVEETPVTKKVWRKPEVKNIAAGAAENGAAGGGDAKDAAKS